MKDSVKSMGVSDATAFAQELKKLLQKKDIWSTITEVNEPELKFIKIEASIKVK